MKNCLIIAIELFIKHYNIFKFNRSYYRNSNEYLINKNKNLNSTTKVYNRHNIYS